MTVSELIAILQTLPGDKQVVAEGEFCLYDIEAVEQGDRIHIAREQ
jgi:hypothetical protein